MAVWSTMGFFAVAGGVFVTSVRYAQLPVRRLGQ
jgi:hypothetical protein